MNSNFIEKAAECRTADELLELARAENVELTDEQVAELKSVRYGELSDDELDDVNGGLLFFGKRKKTESTESRFVMGKCKTCVYKERNCDNFMALAAFLFGKCSDYVKDS